MKFLFHLALFQFLLSYSGECQTSKIEGLWISLQYKAAKESAIREVEQNGTPQYLDIDSLNRLTIINDFEHMLNLGKPIKKNFWGNKNEYYYKNKIEYNVSELRTTKEYITLEINHGVKLLFIKTKLPNEN